MTRKLGFFSLLFYGRLSYGKCPNDIILNFSDCERDNLLMICQFLGIEYNNSERGNIIFKNKNKVERFGIFAPGKEGEDFKRKLPEKKRKEDAKSTKNAEIITINGEEIDKNDIIINQEQLTKEIVEDMKMKVGEIFDKNTSMGDLDRLVELVDYNLTQVKKG